MENIFTLSGQHPPDEIKPVVSDALKKETDFAHTRLVRFEKECSTFEKQYSMDSEQFISRFESGELGDDLHWFDWYAAFRGKMLWGKKYDILRGISWKT